MSKTYTVITQHTNGLVYPVIVRGVETAKAADKEIWRLGSEYTIIATIEGTHNVQAPAYGIEYEITVEQAA